MHLAATEKVLEGQKEKCKAKYETMDRNDRKKNMACSDTIISKNLFNYESNLIFKIIRCLKLIPLIKYDY